MIGLDTNILVRYLTQDDPMQSPKARKITAMIALKDGQGSFADAVIAALGARMGCSCTLTFDRKALRLPGFELPYARRTQFSFTRRPRPSSVRVEQRPSITHLRGA